ncbi:MAG TPA: hypothetical protein VEG39_17055 [Clostridia bacterium]|nr:hypothetical protein [Clostridia bacterium]
MSQNSYNSIKKYAAFIFMVFTVLSGSSDSFDTDSLVKIGRKAFIDILASNKMFIQESRITVSQSHIRSSGSEDEGFRRFLDTNVEASSLNYFQSYAAPLIISVFYLNNLILKNNIWKSAVF